MAVVAAADKRIEVPFGERLPGSVSGILVGLYPAIAFHSLARKNAVATKNEQMPPAPKETSNSNFAEYEHHSSRRFRFLLLWYLKLQINARQLCQS
jgi:hypothetical protein